MMFMSFGVAVLWTPKREVGEPGIGTRFSLMAMSCVEYGTSRRTCFLIRTS